MIPKEWRKLKLNEVGEIVSGGTPSTKEPSYWGEEISWISPADLTGYSNKYISRGRKSITKAGLKKSSAKLIPRGSVLFSSRAPIGYVAIANSDLSTNQGFKSIVPNSDIDSEFLYYYLKYAKPQAVEAASGTTFKEISLSKFSQLEIFVPPLAIQKKVVSKIEELFSELDKGLEQLKIAQQQLKTYRQSVLKWAFEDDEWDVMLVKNVVQKTQIGPFGTQLHKEDYVENGIPLVNPMHIQEGVICADNKYSISVEKRDSLPNYILTEGDVIMGRRGEMGRCALVSKKESGWFCGTGSLFYRPKKELVEPRYLYYYLSGDRVKKFLEQNAGGTTMANLNLKIANEVPFVLPPIDVQERVIDEIESRLSIAEKMDDNIYECLQQAEALRQSILKKAFEGTLI